MIDFNRDYCKCPCCGEQYPAKIVEAAISLQYAGIDCCASSIVHVVIVAQHSNASIVAAHAAMAKAFEQCAKLVEEFDECAAEFKAEHEAYQREIAEYNRALWSNPLNERTNRTVEHKPHAGRYLSGIPPPWFSGRKILHWGNLLLAR